MIARTVSTETLDWLAADDPRALRSRRDLRRINRVMGSGAILRRALRPFGTPAAPSTRLRMLEIGAGDGSLMLAVATRLAPAWPGVDLSLLDRQPLVDAQTVAAFGHLGWVATSLAIDVLDWAVPPSTASHSLPGTGYWDLIVANLFLHHFEGPELTALLGAIAARCAAFCACEPRRGWLPLAASHLVGAIGANAVTREDAVLSVHAGFRDDEIGALWPSSPPIWDTREYSAGLFSHCFSARRRAPAAIEAQ